MAPSLLLVALAVVCLSTAATATMPVMNPPCDADIPCAEVAANGLTFNCRQLTTTGADKQVLFLHGFPEFSRYWIPLMKHWKSTGAKIDATACDLRGYSPKASPDGIGNYKYSDFKADVWALAFALNYDRFHLIGHDHGAGLGWVVAADESDNAQSDRIISYTALSVWHVTAFSDSLFGPTRYEEQVVASNYFNQWALADSATRGETTAGAGNGYFTTMGQPAGFTSAAAFQKALWW